jgi:hypothetical protein
MSATFKQFTPSELYISLSEPVSPDTTNPTNIPASGCDFLDVFVKNLRQYGYRTTKYHARLLGISPTELSFTVLTLTGMTFTDFVIAYILLMANDLLKEKKRDLKAVSERLGFGSYSGFYRFIMRNMKEKPSWL